MARQIVIVGLMMFIAIVGVLATEEAPSSSPIEGASPPVSTSSSETEAPTSSISEAPTWLPDSTDDSSAPAPAPVAGTGYSHEAPAPGPAVY